jgi:hypothetical protein
MARPIKEGLDYFPLDVDSFGDYKILLVEEKLGYKASYVAIRLLCIIYRESYYIRWDSSAALATAKMVGNNIKSDEINEIVKTLVDVGFFDRVLLESKGILTSRGIQKRWQLITHLLKRKGKIKPEFMLLDSEETNDTTGVTVVNSEETGSETELSTQRKGKEKKEKEKKGEEREGSPSQGSLKILEKNEFSYNVGSDGIADLKKFVEQTWPKMVQELKEAAKNDETYILFFKNFSARYIQKCWKDLEDLRSHVASSFAIFIQKEQVKMKLVPKSNTPKKEPEIVQSKEAIDKKIQELDILNHDQLIEEYERFLQGSQPNDKLGVLQRYLQRKGKLNGVGTVSGVFQKVKDQGITMEEYLRS